MKWYTCINEAGLDLYRDHLRVALGSCRAKTGLDPHIIFDGDPRTLRSALGRTDFTLHPRQSGLLPDILRVPEQPGYKHRIAAGAFLRLEISRVDPEAEFVLYTDCDVMFGADPGLEDLRPAEIAAAPEMDRENWSAFNSGVMLFNMEAARRSYEPLLATARPTLGRPHFYDQGVYNLFYAGRWERLPLAAHWKPYWGLNPDATILHFHGTKLSAMRRMIDGTGDAVVHAIWREMFESNQDAYRHYYRVAQSYLAA